MGVTQDIVELLNHSLDDEKELINLLFFNGLNDLICNHVGNEIALENLEWRYKEEYVMAKRYGWGAEATKMVAGYFKSYKNLMFLKVKDSGHMVPMDVPDVALEMMQTLIHKPPTDQFQSYQQLLGRRVSAPSDCPVCPATPAATSEAGNADCEQNAQDKHDATLPETENVEVDDAGAFDDLSQERILIGFLLVILFMMSCWIALGGRRNGRRTKRSAGARTKR